MGTLKTTLKIESTTLFPTPVNFTVINNNTVEGSFSGFNSVIVNSSTGTQMNLGVIDGASGYAYLYARNSGSTGIINLYTEDPSSPGATAYFSKLYPQDIAFLPYSSEDNSVRNLYADCTGSSTAALEYFIGERN